MHNSVQGCVDQPVHCLDNWIRENTLDFDYIFLPKQSTGDDCCLPLMYFLEMSKGYSLVVDLPGATIFSANLSEDG